ncbi:MAG: efflux RND transporter periplasmic adaptor subunit [bacterium]
MQPSANRGFLKVISLLILALILCACAFWIYQKARLKEKFFFSVPTTRVKRSEFIIKVTEMGKLTAQKSISISAPFEGKLTKLCKEGIMVKPGDFLAQMDTTDLERKLSDQTVDYSKAVSDVRKAREELRIMKIGNAIQLRQQKAQLDFDRTELEQAKAKLAQQERLLGEFLVTRQQVDDSRIQVRAKELAAKKNALTLQSDEKKLKSNELQKESEIDNFQIVADKKKADLDAARDDLSKATVKAPSSGLVVFNVIWKGGEEGKINEGDSVWRRMNIMQIPDLSSIIVNVPIGEMDIHKVKVGAEVIIRLDAYPDDVFHGAVREIAKLATEGDLWSRSQQPGKKSFEVTVSIRERNPDKLKPGITANVEIYYKKIEDAVFAPIEAVLLENGKKTVYVKADTGYKQFQVETGDRNENDVVITKGLAGGEEIALRDPTKPVEEALPTPGQRDAK